jgi:hypothetical protein
LTIFCLATIGTAPRWSGGALVISVGGSMPILLVTYHYLVRFTWIGAMLNGRRHPRGEKAPPPDAATAPG